MTTHRGLPILVRTIATTLYTVGCSCGWRWEDTNEEWAEAMVRDHLADHALPTTPAGDGELDFDAPATTVDVATGGAV